MRGTVVLIFALCAAAWLSAPLNASAVGNRHWDISKHGAVGDGKTLNTKAIQAAIDDCTQTGGGTIIVPKGTFLSGSIFLKQGVNLQVDGVLKGSQDTNDYPWINTRIAGLEMKWPAALINASGVTNLELGGKGTIDGSGSRWWNDYWTARKAETNDIDPHFKVPRPRLIHIINSQNIVVRDLMLKDSAFWNLQLTYCNKIDVDHLRVREPVKAASSDGVDIDSSCNVVVENCDISCDDDAICLKSGRDADGLRVNKPTENVEIRNCHVGHAAAMVAFGSETSGGIRHVTVHDCRADNGCGEVVRFKTRMGRGGVVEDVVYDHIQAENVRQVFGFTMDAFSTTWLPEQFRTMPPASIGTPVFRDITIENLQANKCDSAGRIVGLAESPIRDVKLKNVKITNADKGFTVQNTQGFMCANVTVNGRLFNAPIDAKLESNDQSAN